jgi:alanyl-tRNA synthetase
MRRAIRFAVRLDLPVGFFAMLCAHVCEQLGGVYPELVKAKSLIGKAVQAEDEGCRATIHRGLRLIAEASDWQAGPDGHKMLSGQTAFALHDTYGFPLDLTQVIGREQGFSVDEVGFATEMKKQRERSKFSGSGDQAVAVGYHAVRSAHGGTTFLGYDAATGETGTGRVLAIFQGSDSVARAEAGQEVEVIVDRTPFYGRSGGQVGDTGRITVLGGSDELDVTDTLKPLSDLHVHRGRMKTGSLSVGDEVTLQVDATRRNRTRRNHSATHLLHHALRTVLGEHVTQKGSYVGPDKLTFDFSHFQPLTDDELLRVERMVNELVRGNAQAQSDEVSFDEAQKRGAMALFGEKYGDRVRMLHIGPSLELCGGTHVRRAGDIGLLKVTSEAGIAKGIRRIEALTGDGAEELLTQQQAELLRASALLRCQTSELAERVTKVLDELKARERDVLALQKKLASAGGAGLYAEEKTIGDWKVVARRVEGADAKALREVAEDLRNTTGAHVVAVGTVADGKVALVVAVDKALSEAGKLHAGKLVGGLAGKVGGKGGGRADVAQAGGSETEKLDEALALVFALVRG